MITQIYNVDCVIEYKATEQEEEYWVSLTVEEKNKIIKACMQQLKENITGSDFVMVKDNITLDIIEEII